MEFSLRGPATGDDHRFPDPPPHGEQEPKLVMRDALLSQLHMACLRREIIEAELAEIERAMSLCAATGGHQTQTTQMPMPMPWHGVAAADAGRSKLRPFNAVQPMALQNAEFDEHKLPDSDKVVPPGKASHAEKWELTEITIPVMQPKWNCTVCQVQATSEQNLQQHYDGQKHLSNVAALDPTTKASDQKAKSAAEHSLGTERKKTSSVTWSCSTCQAKEGNMDGMPKNVAAQEAKSQGIIVPRNSDKPCLFITEQLRAQEFNEHKLPDSNKVQAISEQDLQQHYAGQKHLSNVVTLDPTTKESDQNMKTAAEPSLCIEQKKMSSIKWSYSTCQANGTPQSTLEAHLKGRRQQQNIAATSVEGDKNGIPKNVMAQDSINVPTHLEKPPSAWSCSICQVICTCQTDLKNHLMGIRHREKVQSLLEQSKNKASDSELLEAKLNPDSIWICRICHAHCTCESDLEKHVAGKRHQLNIQVLREKQPSLCFCEVCNLLFESSTMLAHHRYGKKHRAKLSARNELS